MTDQLEALKNSLASKGFTDEQVNAVIDSLGTFDLVPARKEYAIRDKRSGKMELLAKTTLDYTLPEDQRQTLVRLSYVGQWEFIPARQSSHL
jgi:hypothetical protein